MGAAARLFSGPGATPGVVGAILASQLVLFGALGSATTETVYFAGRELGWGCSFREWFGVPCPNCGMTRSVLLSLHGRVGDALATNPAGLLLVVGVALFSAAMFWLMIRERRGGGVGAARARRLVTRGAVAYAALLVAVWAGHWLLAIT